ncbi:hypothetical protein F8271_30455 [Micromonospora sp. ALFpr18c]|uniref:hypothetical protein n=1 Tax=unclassified Micromonospora TaxID=2617518 RepID=UPI00124B410E|nr:hypothetical protein [Micromonospora sp. ALFpr18c]KAB1925299.1 hypothetical protein F8271_30455 [Micromonospora sp. ALFpr18c]
MTPEQKKAFERVSSNLAPYVIRQYPKRLDLENPISQAYLYSRNQDGTLKSARDVGVKHASELFLEHVNSIQREGGVFTEMGEEGLARPGISADFPEIESFLNRSDRRKSHDTNSHPSRALRIVIETEAVQLVIFADSTEPATLRDRRVEQITDAVSRVTKAGFSIPSPLEFYLPKYSRGIHLPSLRVVDPWNSFADFYAPNKIMLSPQLLSTSPPNGAPDSVALELGSPSAAIIHEIGHCLHFAHAPERFVDLFHTKLSPRYQRAASDISGYAARNPHEFTAEVFTAATLKCTIRPEQGELYRALGGPLPARSAPQRTVDRALLAELNKSHFNNQRTLAAAAAMRTTAEMSRNVTPLASLSWTGHVPEADRTNSRKFQ